MAFQSAFPAIACESRPMMKSYSAKASEAYQEISRIIRAFAKCIEFSNIKRSEDVIRILVDVTGYSGAFLSYRGTINHFLGYLEIENVKIGDIKWENLENFWKHNCSHACWPARGLSPSQTVAVTRFYLFLQYQGIIDSNGWDSNDPDICADFLEALTQEGVHPDQAKRQARTALHLIVWLRLRGIPESCLSDHILDDFVGHSCRCGMHIRSGRPGAQAKSRRRVAVDRFLRFRNGENPVFKNGIFLQKRRRSHPSSTVVRYRTWLTDQRGLRPRTIYYYVLDVMSWLPRLGEDASAYSATAIRELAVLEFAKRTPAMQSRFIRSVRSYMRFRAFEGHCNASLANALISRPTYRLSTVPRRLDTGIVNKVIDSCDLSTSYGIRERAILTLLAELGLRASEVWKLKLSDLDWTEAKLCIEGKGGRGSIVPLTQGAGDAVLDYLEKGRPSSRSEALFLRVPHPHMPLANGSEISGIARKALARCGLEGGAHVFRHTLATELLRDGKSLEDVATILRHRSVDTTTIYAKVNEPMLKRLAEPWLGGRS